VVLQIRTSALFSAKNFEVFDIYGVSAWTRGSIFFFDFVRMSFMDNS